MTSFDLKLKKYGDTSFITGLRAYAVFAVIMIHCGGAGLRDFGEIGNSIADWGKYGVDIFFVISGFAITTSYYKEKSTVNFYIKRLIRIIPLYYIIIVTYYLLGKHNEVSLLLHMLFINWTISDYANNVLSVEWSIAVEVFFYAIFPFILRNASAGRIAQYAFLSFGFFVFLHFFILLGITHDFLPKNINLFYHFSPFQHFFSFLIGSLAYFLRRDFSVIIDFFRQYIIVLGFALTIQIWLIGVGPEFIVASMSTFLIIIGGGNNSKVTQILMENKFALFLGKISYSLYLTHMIVLWFVKDLWTTSPVEVFLLTSIFSIALSTLTHFLIEEPPQKWLKRWMARQDEKQQKA